MKYRKLRFAWSVTWGVVAVLLCVLWVRSYSQADYFLQNKARPFRITASSVSGRVVIWIGESRGVQNSAWESLSIENVKPLPSGTLWFTVYSRKLTSRSGAVGPDRVGIQIPHWFVVATVIFAAAFPWLTYRFSLRTLLIATTAVAVVLGLIVWMR